MDRSEDGSNAQRGFVVKRDLDAERQGRLDNVVEQAMRPFMWTLPGIAIMLFILPVISGPIHGWIDSVHHTLSRTSLEKTATSPVKDQPLTFKLSILASNAESVARAYLYR